MRAGRRGRPSSIPNRRETDESTPPRHTEGLTFGSPSSREIFNLQNLIRYPDRSRDSKRSSYSSTDSPRYVGHLPHSKPPANEGNEDKSSTLKSNSTHSLPSKVHTYLEDLQSPKSSLQLRDDHRRTAGRADSSKADEPHQGFDGNINPPRPAREGFEWVWFPAGFWAERKVEEQSQGKEKKVRTLLKSIIKSSSSSGGTSKSGHPLSGSQTPISTREFIESGDSFLRSTMSDSSRDNEPTKVESTSSTKSTTASNKLRRGFSYISPAYPHFTSPSGAPEGLLCKTKRGIIQGFDIHSKSAMSSSMVGRTPTATSLTLEGVAQYLERVRSRKMKGLESRTSLDTTKRGYGLAPWHRQASDTSLVSASESIRVLLMGTAPPSTPKAEETYLAEKGKVFQRVEISSSDDPTFLPSEARRINTPPMSQDTSTGQSRSIFFDFKAPDQETSRSISDTDSSTPGKMLGQTRTKSGTRNPSGSREAKHWFDEDLDRKAKQRAARQEIKPKAFELQVPEHLPSSPLCPMNPLHPSRGKGICVYHGRNSTMKERGKDTSSRELRESDPRE